MVNRILHNRMDIIGPSGVGKTTIYNEVCRHWHISSPWIYLEKLQINHSYDQLRSGNFKKRVLNQIKVLLNVHARKLSAGLGIRFIEENQNFASFIWTLLGKNNENNPNRSDFRIRTAYIIYKDFERIQFIKETDDTRPCLIVEGLLQKFFLRNDINNSSDEILHKYLSYCPLPTTVFILNTYSPDEIVKRKKSRSKRNAGEVHYNENDFLESVISWQKLFMKMEKHLVEFGVNVQHINTSCPIKESAHEIIKFIDRQQRSDLNVIPGQEPAVRSAFKFPDEILKK